MTKGGQPKALIYCLFVLRFNVPVNNLSAMSGHGHCFQGINPYLAMSVGVGANLKLPTQEFFLSCFYSQFASCCYDGSLSRRHMIEK